MILKITDITLRDAFSIGIFDDLVCEFSTDDEIDDEVNTNTKYTIGLYCELRIL